MANQRNQSPEGSSDDVKEQALNVNDDQTSGGRDNSGQSLQGERVQAAASQPSAQPSPMGQGMISVDQLVQALRGVNRPGSVQPDQSAFEGPEGGAFRVGDRWLNAVGDEIKKPEGVK